MITITFNKPINAEFAKHLAEQTNYATMLKDGCVIFLTDYYDLQSFGYSIEHLVSPLYHVIKINEQLYVKPDITTTEEKPVKTEHGDRFEKPDTGTDQPKQLQSKGVRKDRKPKR